MFSLWHYISLSFVSIKIASGQEDPTLTQRFGSSNAVGTWLIRGVFPSIGCRPALHLLHYHQRIEFGCRPCTCREPSGGGVASPVFAASISCWSRAISTRFPTSWSCTTQSNQQKTWRKGASASVVSAARQMMAHVVAFNRIQSLRQCSTFNRVYLLFTQLSLRILFGSLQVPGAWPRRYLVYK